MQKSSVAIVHRIVVIQKSITIFHLILSIPIMLEKHLQFQEFMKKKLSDKKDAYESCESG